MKIHALAAVVVTTISTCSASDQVGKFKRQTDYPSSIRTSWQVPMETVKTLVKDYLKKEGERIPEGSSFVWLPNPVTTDGDERYAIFGVDADTGFYLERKK